MAQGPLHWLHARGGCPVCAALREPLAASSPLFLMYVGMVVERVAHVREQVCPDHRRQLDEFEARGERVVGALAGPKN